MAKGMEDIAIGLLKGVQAINKDQVVADGRIKNVKKFITRAFMKLPPFFVLLTAPVEPEQWIDTSAARHIHMQKGFSLKDPDFQIGTAAQSGCQMV